MNRNKTKRNRVFEYGVTVEWREKKGENTQKMGEISLNSDVCVLWWMSLRIIIINTHFTLRSSVVASLVPLSNRIYFFFKKSTEG